MSRHPHSQRRAPSPPTLTAVAPARTDPPAPRRPVPPEDPRDALTRWCSSPWPLNEEEIDLPFGAEAPDAPSACPDCPVTIGTVQAAFGADALYGGHLHWHDIEVRVDPPFCVEIGGYVLARREADKLRLWLELALFLLNEPEGRPDES